MKNDSIICDVFKLIKRDDLVIPNYQRPYKWDNHNVEDLLEDINEAIKNYRLFGTDFKYRIGTVILHKENKKGNIVDGQQRIVTLLLIYLYLNLGFKCKLLEREFRDKTTLSNIQDNYRFIKEWFSLKSEDEKKAFSDAFEDLLEVVVVTVKHLSEAFQLFDSQNTRGRALDPHDLLKAYHLREMKKTPFEMEHAVEQWEAKKTDEIRDLFDLYLFRIINWSQVQKSKKFTAKEIDIFKGVKVESAYTYANRAFKAMPYFQITEPFIAGGDFFEMTDHYLEMLDDIHKEIDRNVAFEDLKNILPVDEDDRSVKNGVDRGSVGFKYACNLFYCALMCFYDRFHNFDEMAVKKLFTWAMMIRVDVENLGFDSINKYAVGEQNNLYTNNIPMFTRIVNARKHTDISNIKIVYLRNPDKANAEKWNKLYIALKKINGK